MTLDVRAINNAQRPMDADGQTHSSTIEVQWFLFYLLQSKHRATKHPPILWASSATTLDTFFKCCAKGAVTTNYSPCSGRIISLFRAKAGNVFFAANGLFGSLSFWPTKRAILVRFRIVAAVVAVELRGQTSPIDNLQSNRKIHLYGAAFCLPRTSAFSMRPPGIRNWRLVLIALPFNMPIATLSWVCQGQIWNNVWFCVPCAEINVSGIGVC